MCEWTWTSASSLWDTVVDVSEPSARGDPQRCPKQSKPKEQVGHDDFDLVTPNAHITSMRRSLYVMEKGSCDQHVSHRFALDWLFDRINLDKAIQFTYVNTAQQIADVLTRGSSNTLMLPFVVVASCLKRNKSKRTGEMPNEQVSAK